MTEMMSTTKKPKKPKAPKLFPDELIDQLLAQEIKSGAAREKAKSPD